MVRPLKSPFERRANSTFETTPSWWFIIALPSNPNGPINNVAASIAVRPMPVKVLASSKKSFADMVAQGTGSGYSTSGGLLSLPALVLTIEATAMSLGS